MPGSASDNATTARVALLLLPHFTKHAKMSHSRSSSPTRATWELRVTHEDGFLATTGFEDCVDQAKLREAIKRARAERRERDVRHARVLKRLKICIENTLPEVESIEYDVEGGMEKLLKNRPLICRPKLIPRHYDTAFSMSLKFILKDWTPTPEQAAQLTSTKELRREIAFSFDCELDWLANHKSGIVQFQILKQSSDLTFGDHMLLPCDATSFKIMMCAAIRCISFGTASETACNALGDHLEEAVKLGHIQFKRGQ